MWITRAISGSGPEGPRKKTSQARWPGESSQPVLASIHPSSMPLLHQSTPAPCPQMLTRAGLLGPGGGQRRDHVARGLGLPPGVHNGAAAVAHHLWTATLGQSSGAKRGQVLVQCNRPAARGAGDCINGSCLARPKAQTLSKAAPHGTTSRPRG